MIVILAIGVLLAAAIFAAFMWSGFQAFFSRGSLRWAHGISAGATIGGMAALGNEALIAAMASGLVLLLSSGFAVVKERRWTRLLPFFQILFALVLISGIPFGVAPQIAGG